MKPIFRGAIEKKICNICLDGLKQADSIFSTSIPPSVFETLHEKGADEEVTIATASSTWKMTLLDFKTLPDLKSRFLLLKEHLLPSPDYIMNKFETDNRMAGPFLYFKRIFQGVWKRMS